MYIFSRDEIFVDFMVAWLSLKILIVMIGSMLYSDSEEKYGDNYVANVLHLEDKAS